MMHSRFEMSLIGEMKFFLGLQIQQSPRGIFINQAKYALEILKNMGLWYPKDSGFELTAVSYADHVGCIDTHKSTSGGIQFLGEKLVSWMSKKHDCTAMSIAEEKYVALSASCAQVMWMRTQLKDYAFDYNKIPLTKYQLADMFTKALSQDRFAYLVRRLGIRCLTPAEPRVILFSIYSDDGNSSSVNIKQHCVRAEIERESRGIERRDGGGRDWTRERSAEELEESGERESSKRIDGEVESPDMEYNGLRKRVWMCMSGAWGLEGFGGWGVRRERARCREEKGEESRGRRGGRMMEGFGVDGREELVTVGGGRDESRCRSIEDEE
ncbi:hypothetical protein Tco_1226981 [Tanacetum coccineum]